ncbi:MAG: DsbA family protein [Thaumarchaeota archaeon]|nr:DsbA family protein [Nitrososphaerota archaeon]
MNTKGIIVGAIVAIIAIGIILSYSSAPSETVNLDMGRTHGDVSTAMGSPILGDPDAPITIVEFGDYQCSSCYNWFHKEKPAIYENYIATGKANLVFVDLAILGRDSLTAAQASYCAEDQGMYWEYHDLLYNSQESKIDNGWANSERLKAFAFSLGLDMDLFESCLDSGKYTKRVQYNVSVAKKHGARATPTFIIVGPDNQQEQFEGAQPYSTFKKIMDNMI